MARNTLTVIINGATGVGKTTASTYLSRKLNCPCISTDHVRRKLRNKLSPKQCSVIFRSSYEISNDPNKDDPRNVIINYIAQAKVIIGEIARRHLRSRGLCKILEGVHLNPAVLSILGNEHYIVFYLRMPAIEEHERRLRQRNLRDQAMNDKHRAYLHNIRVIGTFLGRKWAIKARNNKRVFLIGNWQEVDAILQTIGPSTFGSRNCYEDLDATAFKVLSNQF